MNGFINNLKDFLEKIARKGVVIPFIRDPKTQKASVTLSMMLISFLIAIISIVGKSFISLGDMDSSQARDLFLITAGLYLGRKLSTKKDEDNNNDKKD